MSCRCLAACAVGLFGILVLAAFPARSEPVTIDFTGAVDQFNSGPLTPFSPIVGQIVLDDTVVPFGPNNTFSNVILSFTMTIGEASGDVVFTGSGGEVNQFANVGGTTEFIEIRLGGSAGGILNGSAGGFDATSFDIDFRGANLFDDPTTLATGLTEADFGFSFLTLNFDAVGLDSLMVERALDTVSFSGEPGATSISAPPIAAATFGGILFLAARRQGKRRLNP